MLFTLKKVFSQIRYLIIAVLTTVTVFMFAVWLPNLKLIGTIILSSSVPTIEKMGFLLSLLGSIKTNFTPISASYTIAIAVLFGVNIALLSYYIQDRQSSAVGSGATLSIGGLASGVLGIGCAACGTFILASVLSAFGAVGILSFLPFGGEEFGFLGAGLLLYSTYMISKKINGPLACEPV